MRASISIAALLAIACVTASNSGPENQRVLVTDTSPVRTTTDPSGIEAVVQAPLDRVWHALFDTYGELGVDVRSINQPIGEIGNRDFTISGKLAGKLASTWFSCGLDPNLGPQANMYRIRASLLSTVRAEGAGATRIESRLAGTTRRTGVNAEPIYCATTGALENRIVASLTKRLGL